MKKALSVLLASVMAAAALAGCGGGGAQPSPASENGGKTQAASEADQSGAAKGASAEKRKVVIYLNGMDEEQKMKSAMDEIKALDKYQDIEFDFRGRDADFNTKVPVEIAGGNPVDLIIVANPILQQQYVDSGMIQPLDDIIQAAGVDYEKEFGPYVENAMNNGQIFTVPHNITRWVITYNKAVFDAAGEPYPDPEIPMTWDEYAEVAKRITQGEGADKIYGAFYLPWGTFSYGDAIMELGGGEHFYNEEGLSNIDNPAFARSMERLHKMMHEDGSTPTHANAKTSKTSPTDFLNGRYGMAIGGGWNLSWVMDREANPRDWKVGVAPMPVDAGTTTKTWGIVNGFGIPISAPEPELSFEIAMDLVKLSAKYADTTESASRTVPQDLLFVEAAKALEDDGITLESLLDVFTNEKTVFVGEKIMGPNNVAYEKVYMEEVEKYLVDEQDLKTTIENIKKRGDKAISGD